MLTVMSATAIIFSCNSAGKEQSDNNKADTTAQSKSAFRAEYTCPMDTDVHSDKPGKCPKCGMEMVKQTQNR